MDVHPLELIIIGFDPPPHKYHPTINIDLQPSTEPTEEHQTTTEASEFNPYMHHMMPQLLLLQPPPWPFLPLTDDSLFLEW